VSTATQGRGPAHHGARRLWPARLWLDDPSADRRWSGRCKGAGAALLLAAAAVCAGCASKEPPPKPPTEAEVRSHWTDEETTKVLNGLDDAAARAALTRYFAAQAREASQHGMQLAVESIKVGEDIGIGGGMSMKRLFVLYHEYDDQRFISYLAGFETVAGRLQSEYHRPVGGSKVGIAKLDFVELNRAIITLYAYAPGDPPCCPTKVGKTGFQLGAASLEPLE